MDYDEDTEDANVDELARVVARLRAGRVRLRLTVHAVQQGRRTPEQREAVMNRSRRLVHQSLLIRRKIQRHLGVH
jgi:hypothetical protein